MNKKGLEQVISVYWFAILIIVAGGIFAMVYTFYNSPYDIREVEATFLANKISSCLSENGKLNLELNTDGVFNESFKNNFLDKCSINFDVEKDFEEKNQFYVKINFFKLEDLGDSIFEISEGNKNLESNCEIQEDEEHEKLAKCMEKNFYSLDNKNNQYIIKILSVVRKTEKNVK